MGEDARLPSQLIKVEAYRVARIGIAGLLGLGIASLLLVFHGCGSGGNAFSPTEAFASSLRRQAEALAETELAKFNRVEETYKATVRLDLQPTNEATTGGGVFYRKYRHFKRFEVVDVERTNSYLKPIQMVIRFHYDLMGTTPRHTDFPDSERLAAQDSTFEKLRERYITRRYKCDYRGTYDGALPEIPPLDNLFYPPEP